MTDLVAAATVDLDLLVDELAQEQEGLREIVRDAGEDVRGRVTPAVGWDVGTQLAHLAQDTSLRLEGDAAREWMDVAQCHAGPPGDHRPAGSFPDGWRASIPGVAA